MDVLYYHTPETIKLNDVQFCLQKAGYSAVFGIDPVSNETTLYVAFIPAVYPDHTMYWRWILADVGWNDIDDDEREVVASIWKAKATSFAVWYPMVFMDDFGGMMRYVLHAYGGHVSFEYALFDRDNILSIGGHVPEPPPDLRDE
ncbi:MAG: hypothetical protein AAF653_16750 [Chloroflexota bacterium]